MRALLGDKRELAQQLAALEKELPLLPACGLKALAFPPLHARVLSDV